MANWIKQPCIELLNKINNVPNDDQREDKQLSILMNGLAEMNKEMMRRAAESARAQFGEFSSESSAKSKPKTPQKEPEQASEAKKALDDTPDLDDFDSFDEELDMIEQTLIRSIGD